MRYQFIQENEGLFPLKALCRIMKVSTSGYHDFKKRKPSKRALERETLLASIQKYFDRSDSTYGSLRIWRDVLACKDLRNAGITSGRNRVARLMRQAGLKATVAPKFVVTTDSKHVACQVHFLV